MAQEVFVSKVPSGNIVHVVRVKASIVYGVLANIENHVETIHDVIHL